MHKKFLWGFLAGAALMYVYYNYSAATTSSS